MANKYRSVLASGGGVQPTGNAQPADVLSGKTFSNADGINKVGSMVNNGAVTQTLDGGQSYTIPAGYHNGSGVITAAMDAILQKGEALYTYQSGSTPVEIESLPVGSTKSISNTTFGSMIYRVADSITKIKCSRLVNTITIGYGIKNGVATALTKTTVGYVDSFDTEDYEYVVLSSWLTTGTSAQLAYSVE